MRKDLYFPIVFKNYIEYEKKVSINGPLLTFNPDQQLTS